MYQVKMENQQYLNIHFLDPNLFYISSREILKRKTPEIPSDAFSETKHLLELNKVVF